MLLPNKDVLETKNRRKKTRAENIPIYSKKNVTGNTKFYGAFLNRPAEIENGIMIFNLLCLRLEYFLPKEIL